MKNLMSQFVKVYDTHDDFQRQMDRYDRTLKTDEWKFVRDVLITIKSTMMQELLTAKHTDLPADEKDVMQRTYYNVNQTLDFLMQPTNWIRFKKKRLTNSATLKQKPQATVTGKEN